MANKAQSLLSLDEWSSKRLELVTLGLSIVLHGLLVLSLGAWLARGRIVMPTASKDQEKVLTFRLVETPESARSETPPEEAQAVSDKQAHAQNPQAPDNLPEGEAYSPVLSPLRGEGGLTGSEMAQPVPPAIQGQPPNPSTNRLTSDERPTEPASNQQFASVLRRVQKPKFSPEVLGQRMDQEIRPKAGGGQQDSRSRYIGPFSLNTYAWDYAPYVLHMKRKLERNLYPPPAFTRLGIISGNVVLHFRVMPDGHVEDLRVEEYDCHPSLVETSLQAVRNSSPFRPLPSDFPEPYLELRWTFMYIVYR